MSPKNTTIDKILVIGAGEVVQQRFRPAQKQLRAEGIVSHTTYADISHQCPFGLEEEESAEAYIQIDESSVLFLDEFARHGALGPNVLTVVCSPTRFHAHYAKQFLGTKCRIAVEKPLTQGIYDAQSLLPFDDVIFSVGHQLFKSEMLHFLSRCEKGEEL